jgi:hypothetical protein
MTLNGLETVTLYVKQHLAIFASPLVCLKSFGIKMYAFYMALRYDYRKVLGV